ncbi:MAG: trans-aconitate 2-methyltransferase [Bradyrhizobium sp.]|nr:MAG: trans-aconitate 2-methyltransferase [Bradyrhizobium sp.]
MQTNSTTRDWSAQAYRRFERERSRPAAELLSRVPARALRRAVDLGCGPGNSTALIAERFPGAEIIGLDSSPDMLTAARSRLPRVTFRQGDIVDFDDPAADLVFANAAMHWVPNHIAVMRRIAERLPPLGCLAVQMPDNENEPTHALMREIAAGPRFRVKLADAAAARQPIGAFADYDDALSPFCDEVDIWRTTYVHCLAGSDAIVAWVESAGLRPFLSPLDADERAEYLALYREGVARAYPPRAGGGALLPFPRLFIVATRREKD